VTNPQLTKSQTKIKNSGKTFRLILASQ